MRATITQAFMVNAIHGIKRERLSGSLSSLSQNGCVKKESRHGNDQDR